MRPASDDRRRRPPGPSAHPGARRRARRAGGRRRRPTGAAPPLPRSLGYDAEPAGSWCARVAARSGSSSSLRRRRPRRATNRVDAAILRLIAGLANAVADDVADAIDRVGVRVDDHLDRLRSARRAASSCKRWRHLFTFLGATFVIEIIAERPLPLVRRARGPTT